MAGLGVAANYGRTMPQTDGAIESAEESRLELLDDLDIFDTEPEASFDTLTSLAAQICGEPVSVVSLIDSERQFFKSRHGIDLVETPREFSFCSHAIGEASDATELFEVPDTHRDERFSTNPLVVDDPRIRHYAAVPLRPSGDTAVGTLCVIGPKSRTLDETQRSYLKQLGGVAEELLRIRLVAKTEAAAHRRAERSEQHYRYLVDNTADVVFIHDADLVARYLSPNAPAFLGYTYQEVTAFGSGRQVFHPDDARRLTETFKRLTQDRPTDTLRVRALNKDGSTRHVQVHTRAIFIDGAVEEFQTSVRDINDVVAYEKELEETNARLRDLVEQRTNLVRGIAHDLAAPVAAMRLTIESLQSQLTDPAMTNQGARLAEFAQSVEAFLSDLRTVAQPENAGYALDLRPIDARQVVEQAIAQVPDIPGSQLTIDLDRVTAFADHHALSRITTNLLTNAHRHTPAGTPITISLTTEGAMAALSVADLGPGIPSDLRSNVMEPYVSTDPDGSGIGLAITKALVEAQRGQVEIAPNQPNGTVVSVRLPVSR